jgi:hypothetical protein
MDASWIEWSLGLAEESVAFTSTVSFPLDWYHSRSAIKKSALTPVFFDFFFDFDFVCMADWVGPKSWDSTGREGAIVGSLGVVGDGFGQANAVEAITGGFGGVGAIVGVTKSFEGAGAVEVITGGFGDSGTTVAALAGSLWGEGTAEGTAGRVGGVGTMGVTGLGDAGVAEAIVCGLNTTVGTVAGVFRDSGTP